MRADQRQKDRLRNLMVVQGNNSGGHNRAEFRLFENLPAARLVASSQPVADFQHKISVLHRASANSRNASLDGMEQRREPRRGDERLVVTINGRDRTGQYFSEEVVATSISRTGSFLSGISRHVRSGDIIWVEHRGKKSRFKVVWVRDSESCN